MIRLLVIAVIIAGAAYFGLRAFNRMTGGELKKPEPTAAAAPSQPVKAPELPPEPQVLPPKPSLEGGPSAGISQAVSVYVFRNRTVPAAPFAKDDPALGTKQDSRGFAISVDAAANAWILRGSVPDVQQMEHIAAALDIQQAEMDLDFVLIALSENWVNSYGLDAYFKEGASWLNAFQLDAAGGTLNFAAGNLCLTASLQRSDSVAHVVSCPVIRAVAGEKWKFSADTSVPVAQIQRSEGVVSTAYDYREVGLGLEGIVRPGGDDTVRMEIQQRNGSIVEGTGTQQTGVPPSLREQILNTSLVLHPQRWSCIGGVRSWKTVKKKRLLGSETTEEQELLLIFCRPRFALEAIPRAVPVGSRPEHLTDWGKPAWELPADVHPLLPSKELQPWEKEEIELINRQLKINKKTKK